MRRPVQGFTLLEALIALLVLTIGLLGAAGMLVTSVRNSHNSYLRSQASFVVDSLVERMRANPVGIWQLNYNAVLNGSTSEATCSAGCAPAQLAAYDLFVTDQQLVQHLPGGQLQIACNVAGGAPMSSVGVPPVNGSCQITVQWNEQRDVDAAGAPAAQVFQVVVQP